MPTGNQYLQNNQSSAGKTPRPPDEDVKRLIEDYRATKNSKLRDKIVMQHSSLVESVARRFAGSSEPSEDLAQEGYIGLITAVELFDPAKNVKFSTYATHFIIGQIKHYLRDKGKIIKEPAWLQELNQRISKAIESLTQKLHRAPTHKEIARVVGMTEDEVASMLMTREVFKVSSIDGNQETDTDNSGALDIERTKSVEIAAQFEVPLDEKIVLEGAIGKLKALEQNVLLQFYFQDLNQTEIAKRMGISCNYVSHLLRNSTKKLKKILQTEDLRTSQVQISQLRSKLDKQLISDPVLFVDDITRLYNRSYMELRLEEEIRRGSRLEMEVGLMLIRINGLDSLTSQLGSLKHDQALRDITNLIQKSVRKSDIATKYSSNMFAVILPYSSLGVELVETRLKNVIGEWLDEFHAIHNKTILELATGLASSPKNTTDWRELIVLAESRTRINPEGLFGPDGSSRLAA